MGKREVVSDIIDEIVNRFISLRVSLSKDKHLDINRQLKDTLKGKRCFVVGNGPSLNLQDLSLLENKFVFTVNQIARHPQFDSMKTNIHFWADPVFFREDETKESPFLKEMRSVKRLGNNPICFFPSFTADFIKKHNLDKELDVRYFFPRKYFTGQCKKIDFTTAIPGFYTVVDYAIALAVYMGAKEIYLLGCDCTGVTGYVQSKQNETINSYAFKFDNQNDEKHMKKVYDSISCEDMFHTFYMIFRQYRQLNEYCKSKGVSLVNCTGGGILDSLPVKKFEDVVASRENI